MADAIAFIQWDNYKKGQTGRGLFADQPLAFTSRQQRLHSVRPGEQLWLVSRDPADQQYYFVAVLKISQQRQNDPAEAVSSEFGEFSLVAERSKSIDLRDRFPAEGLLRALQFESDKPIKFGASIGQSLQSIRLLTGADASVLNGVLARIQTEEGSALEFPFGVWTKCNDVFARYFRKNWQANRQPIAFLLYDSPPIVTDGAPVFIHSDKNLRLLASFRGSQYVAGYKPTVAPEERLAERERIWTAFRAKTVDPPTKQQFDAFWDCQHGVRSLFFIDNIIEVPTKLQFKAYGQALEWGYPIGVGYRYLSLSQSFLLLRACGISEDEHQRLMAALVR